MLGDWMENIILRQLRSPRPGSWPRVEMERVTPREQSLCPKIQQEVTAETSGRVHTKGRKYPRLRVADRAYSVGLAVLCQGSQISFWVQCKANEASNPGICEWREELPLPLGEWFGRRGGSEEMAQAAVGLAQNEGFIYGQWHSLRRRAVCTPTLPRLNSFHPWDPGAV